MLVSIRAKGFKAHFLVIVGRIYSFKLDREHGGDLIIHCNFSGDDIYAEILMLLFHPKKLVTNYCLLYFLLYEMITQILEIKDHNFKTFILGFYVLCLNT